jgi:predicted metal-dependent hydrolase
MDYVAQAAAGAVVTLAFFVIIFRATKFLVHADPALPNLGYIRLYWKMRASGKRGSLPKTGYVVRAALRLFRRDYHPLNEGNTAQAVAYLASSPAARALCG